MNSDAVDISTVTAAFKRASFGFFGALTLPLGVFVTDKDFATAAEFTGDVHTSITAAIDHLEELARPAGALH